MQTLVGSTDGYDRNNLPMYVLFDIDNVLERMDGKAHIRGVRWVDWQNAYVVDIYIQNEGGYSWAVNRQDYGKNMPALYADI